MADNNSSSSSSNSSSNNPKSGGFRLIYAVRALRIALGIVSVLLITIVVSLYSLFFAFIRCMRLANIGVRMWAWLCTRITYPIVGITYVVENKEIVRALDPSRPVLLLSNHPRTFEAIAQCDMLRQLFGGSRMIVGVMKRELLYTPLGIGLWAMSTVPIDRKAGQAAIDLIRRWAKSLPDKAPSIILYPDGTRGNAARRQAMSEKLVSKVTSSEDIERIQRVCALTMPPMAGGCQSLLESLPGVQVVIVSCSNSQGLSSIPELIRNPAPLVRVQIKKTVTLPTETVALQRELMKVWESVICPDVVTKQSSKPKAN